MNIPSLVTKIVSAATLPCPLVICASCCISEKGEEGCPKCDCPGTCKDFICPEKLEYVLRNVTCTKNICFPFATCVPKNKESSVGCFAGSLAVDFTASLLKARHTITSISDRSTAFQPKMKRSAGLAAIVAFVVFQMATTQETTTPCPSSRCAPECYSDTGSNGCPTCECPLTCQDANCTADEECVLKNVICVRAPCFPVPTCAPLNETTTSAISDATTTPCAFDDCVPGCERVIGSDGCPTCVCPPTCQDVNCTEDEECVLKEVRCKKAPCFPVPTCVPISELTTPVIRDIATTRCPYEVLCVIGCVRVVGSNGCPTCVCSPTCEGTHCPDGYECEMQLQPCDGVSCTSRPTCIPIMTTTPCPMITCAPDCFSVTGRNGCDTCSCPPTCEDVKCARDEECVLKQLIFCITVPCFPTPICVPRNDSCVGTPNTDRCNGFKLIWFYNSSANACQVFHYYGCTPSPNTFLSPKTCKDKCMNTQPICDCDDDCYTFTRNEQSPKCICPNPCRDVNCSADEVCKLREVNCVHTEKPCNPVPYCAPNSCPTEPPCGIRCLYGLETDKNGCQLCVCRRKPIPCLK